MTSIQSLLLHFQEFIYISVYNIGCLGDCGTFYSLGFSQTNLRMKAHWRNLFSGFEQSTFNVNAGKKTKKTVISFKHSVSEFMIGSCLKLTEVSAFLIGCCLFWSCYKLLEVYSSTHIVCLFVVRSITFPWTVKCPLFSKCASKVLAIIF